MLAMAKAVIAGDTPANRALLTPGEQALLVDPSDPQALAAAILTLHAEPALREGLATQGHQLFQAACSEAVLTQRVQAVVTQMLQR